MSKEVEGVEYVYVDLDTVDTGITTNYRNDFTTLTDTVNVTDSVTAGQVLSGSIDEELNWIEHNDGLWSYDLITPRKNKSLYRYILEI